MECSEIRVVNEPLPPETLVESAECYECFETGDGHEFRFLGTAIVELDARGALLSTLSFPTIAEAEQAWDMFSGDSHGVQ